MLSSLGRRTRILRLYSSTSKSSLICSKFVEALVSNVSIGLMKPCSPVVMDSSAHCPVGPPLLRTLQLVR
jgi:hypothetical protein